MDRRDFLKGALVSVVTIPVIPGGGFLQVLASKNKVRQSYQYNYPLLAGFYTWAADFGDGRIYHYSVIVDDASPGVADWNSKEVLLHKKKAMASLARNRA